MLILSGRLRKIDENGRAQKAAALPDCD